MTRTKDQIIALRSWPPFPQHTIAEGLIIRLRSGRRQMVAQVRHFRLPFNSSCRSPLPMTVSSPPARL